MSAFSFNTTAGASQSAAKSRLTGNDIYTVKFDGCEIVDIKGVKDPSMTYKVLKIHFKIVFFIRRLLYIDISFIQIFFK